MRITWKRGDYQTIPDQDLIKNFAFHRLSSSRYQAGIIPYKRQINKQKIARIP